MEIAMADSFRQGLREAQFRQFTLKPFQLSLRARRIDGFGFASRQFPAGVDVIIPSIFCIARPVCPGKVV